MESFEDRGYWWLPEDPERKLAGILSFSQEEGGKLELWGTLGGANDFSFRTHSLVLGEAVNHRTVTLADCFTKNINSSGSNDFAEYRVHAVYDGIHAGNESDLLFDQVQFGLSYLNEWLNNRTLRPHRTDEEIGVHHIRVPDLSVDVDDFNIKIRQMASASYGKPTSTINEEAAFWVTFPDPLSVEAVVSEYALPLQYLVNLGTGEPNFFTSFHLIKSSAKNYPVKLWYSQTNFAERTDDRLSSHEMIFDCSVIRDEMEEKLRLWMKAYGDIREVMKLFAREHSTTSLTLELQLTTIAQALETYHRVRIRRNDDFIDRLRTIFDRCRLLIEPLVGDLEAFAQIVLDCRNYFTHFGDKQPKVKEINGSTLLLITKCLSVVLRSCLLSELNIPMAEQVKLFNVSKVYYIVKHHAVSLKHIVKDYS